MNNKTYLGDSVYAEFDGYNIVLTTENGFCASNMVVLEREVLERLVRYIEQINETIKSDIPL
jgi:hypothetical protein